MYENNNKIFQMRKSFIIRVFKIEGGTKSKNNLSIPCSCGIMRKKLNMELQKKIDAVQEMRLLEDVFFEAVAQDIPAVQEILRTILEDENLVVESVITQRTISNLYGRGVRLDAMCTMGDGSKCNIEIQRADNDDHLRRARFNAASVTVRESNPGDKFRDVVDVYVVYITEFDIFGYNKTIYHVDKTIRENGVTINDGLHEVFVNTKIKDGTKISHLMELFTKTQFESKEFPALSKRVNFLKTSEGGKTEMDTVMGKLLKEERAEVTNKAILNMIDLGLSKDKILTKYTVEEYETALKSQKTE